MVREGQGFESFLLVECGASTTTAALFDAVDGSQRLIAQATAPTTATAPWNDLLIGVQEAISRLSDITGRPLLTDSGDLIAPAQDDGRGVDHFGVALSVAQPLAIMNAGLTKEFSVASARRATHSIYARELDSISLDDDRSEQERIRTILEQEPEIILLAGGTDGGDSQRLPQLLENVELATDLMNGSVRPHIIFAGNKRMREMATLMLGGSGKLHVADNVRPAADVEQLGDTMEILEDLYARDKVGNVPGIDEVLSWSTLPTRPTARAFAGMIEYLGALYQSHVMGIDLGSNSVTFATADDEEVRLLVQANMGMGQAVANILQAVTPGEVLHWLPVEMSAEALIDYVMDKSVHPSSVALVEDELMIDQALARMMLQHAYGKARQAWQWGEGNAGTPLPNLFILRGNTLANAPRLGQTVLTVLDALQPAGLFSMAVDRYDVMPMLGLIAPTHHEATVQILEGGILLDLGWVVVPVGKGDAGRRALRITVETEEEGEYRIEASFGDLITVPLTAGAPAKLTLSPERGVDIGFGPGRGKKITVHGGAVGLVVDARGRPLRLPADDKARREQLRNWYWDIGG